MKLFAALRRASPSLCPRSLRLSRDLLTVSRLPARPHQYSPSIPRRWTSSFFSGTDDVIFALSTAQGPAGIAVIRVSGPAALDIYRSLCPSKPLPKPRYATLRALYDPRHDHGKEVLDSSALVLYFPAPETVTGEDLVELHVHGGTATVKAILAAIPRCRPSSSPHRPMTHRVRYAEPGEFTKRAFMNGRLDLAQVEALSDVLSAQTEQQRHAAVCGSGGELGRQYEAWRQRLLGARAEIEALIDFSEDQHFDESPVELLSNVTKYVHQLLASIEQYKRGSARSELLRNGIRIAFVGPPNVGKSSLMNLIVGREASIVSSEAGTTRDIVEADLDISGYLCRFADTAGFRSAQETGSTNGIGAVEMEGIRRARLKAEGSDLVVVLAAVEPCGHLESRNGFTIRYDTETMRLAAAAKSRAIVINKIDMVDSNVYQDLLARFKTDVLSAFPELHAADLISISCAQAEASNTAMEPTLSNDPGNIHALTNRLVSSFKNMTSMPVDLQALLGVTERQRLLLNECTEHLHNFISVAQAQDDAEAEADIVIAAEYLRFAANCLAQIIGRGDTPDVEDVLGVVFEK
ncbi:hypothetical protein BROUX41_004635 [Berkeleyomyces rouxiae]|uniref:uncharacterized protein n=1 Tax=Berkeleyomyces rouxiae TaxID=2035830 RepID=UPI003B7BF0D5